MAYCPRCGAPDDDGPYCCGYEPEEAKVAEAEITICVRCRWHRNTHPGGKAGPPRDAWFYQRCGHPEVERPSTIDPVSGKVGYMSKNDLGQTVIDAEPQPFCRTINDGHCRIYEAKP